jgi:hypothetical protein
MPYRLRYTANIDFVPAGRGLGIEAQTGLMPNEAGGPGQTLEFLNIAVVTSTTFTATDVTALLLAMSNDLSAQMSTAAVLGRVTAFASGGG